MKENILKMKEWWSNLASREKRMLTIGGSITAIFLTYQFLWSPYVSYVDDLRDRIIGQQQTLAWMQAADLELSKNVASSHHAAVKTTPIALLSLIKKEVNQVGLSASLKQLKQSNNDSVEIQFQKVNFDKMIALLIDVINEQAVNITQMTVSADKAIGVVNCNVTMRVA